MTQGTANNLQAVSAVAHRVGIDRKSINDIFQKYGNTAQAKILCTMLGTTPEALKKDAETIVGGAPTSSVKPTSAAMSTRFPRLK